MVLRRQWAELGALHASVHEDPGHPELGTAPAGIRVLTIAHLPPDARWYAWNCDCGHRWVGGGYQYIDLWEFVKVAPRRWEHRAVAWRQKSAALSWWRVVAPGVRKRTQGTDDAQGLNAAGPGACWRYNHPRPTPRRRIVARRLAAGQERLRHPHPRGTLPDESLLLPMSPHGAILARNQKGCSPRSTPVPGNGWNVPVAAGAPACVPAGLNRLSEAATIRVACSKSK